MVWCSVLGQNRKKIFLCSFYRPPDEDGDSIVDLSETLRTILKKKNDPIIVVGGDFNLPHIDWVNMSSLSNGRDKNISQALIDTFSLNALEQVNKKVTRESRHGKGNVLDLLATTHPHLIASLSVDDGISDHKVLSANLLTGPMKITKPPRQLYIFRNADFSAFKEYIIQCQDNFFRFTCNNTVNNSWQEFLRIVRDGIAKFVPTKTARDRREPRWTKPKLRALLRKQRILHSRMKKVKAKDKIFEEAHRNYLEARKLAKEEAQREFEEYRSITLLDSLESDSKEFWSYVREARGGQSSIPTLMNVNGDLVSESLDKANLLNEHYKMSFTIDDGYVHEFPNRVDLKMSAIELSMEGIVKLLRQVDTKKSPGPEAIPSLVIRTLADELAPLLLVFFKKSLHEGIVPISWKRAYISPILKKGRKLTPDSYRPISLTSIFCKIMEHIIGSSIMRFLAMKGAINPDQHGFRKGRSCETQLALLYNDIIEAADQGIRTDAVFMDFRKAFDTVSHAKLLQKLKAYAIDNKIVQWIQSFLSNRAQQVVLDGVISDEIYITSGVPQGSVLGPLLFLIYINDLVDNVNSKVRLFADDTLIYREIRSPDDNKILQDDLHIITKWCKDWQLDLNVEKCVAMNITRSLNVDRVQYEIAGLPLEFVQNYKYLGVTLSSNLSFKEHIHNAIGSANRIQRLTNRILRGCSPKVKEVAYYSLVRPLLEYCCAVWNPYEVGLISDLEKVQRRAARFVKGDFRFDSSVSEMIKSLGWDSLKDRRLEYRRKLFEKFTATDLSEDIRDFVIPVSNDRELRDQSIKRYREIIAKTDAYFWSFFPHGIRCANRP